MQPSALQLDHHWACVSLHAQREPCLQLKWKSFGKKKQQLKNIMFDNGWNNNLFWYTSNLYYKRSQLEVAFLNITIKISLFDIDLNHFNKCLQLF